MHGLAVSLFAQSKELGKLSDHEKLCTIIKYVMIDCLDTFAKKNAFNQALTQIYAHHLLPSNNWRNILKRHEVTRYNINAQNTSIKTCHK